MDVPTARHLAGVLADDDADGPSPHDAPPGFEVFHQIGEGASGRVYLAQRDGSDRPVALKVMKQSLGEGKSAQRAWREFELLSQIRSTRIPAVLDHGTHRGRLFIATEFIDGLPIHEAVDACGLDTRARVELLAKVCEAAGELHNHGLIHRDLKPSNILVTPAGEPVIIDLGIAALVSSDVMQTLTADGVPIGTPAYMAPEQARGERACVGVRSDVWALGAVCCRVLTGQPPHNLTDVTLYEAVRRVGAEPARDPLTLDAALPRPLASVISKACSFKPGDRYASATELAADLRRWLRREPVEAQPPGAWVKATRWMTRHPVWTTGGMCAGMLLAAAGATGGILWKMAYEPFDVVTNSDHSRAWIESRTHRTVARIVNRPNAPGSVFAHRIDPPEGQGGRWLAAITVPDKTSRLADLRLIRPELPYGTVWTEPDPGDYPPLAYPSYDTELGRKGHRYSVQDLVVTDIFPGRAGDELAFFHSGEPDFPSCLRVFAVDWETLKGEELFRAWVPGDMRMTWLTGAGCFFLAGPNNRLPTPTWEGLDLAAGERPREFASCAMLVHPTDGLIGDRWLTYKIEGSTSNVDRCWVLVQPATHEPGWRMGSDLPRVYLGLLVGPGAGKEADASAFEIGFRPDGTEYPSTAFGGWMTNSWLDQVAEIEWSNALEASEPFRELREAWGTERFRFEDAPAFDPNPE